MTTEILYPTAAVCFILALKELSSAESARKGNLYGLFGMVITCAAAYLNVGFPDSTLWAIVAGGAIGLFVAATISMTALPQMIAGFHSLVGLAAVFVAFAAYYAPASFRIISDNGGICFSSLAEIGLGSAIGAVTFTGSAIAFLKLHGLCGKHRIPPIVNILSLLSIFALLGYFTVTGSESAVILLTTIAFILGIFLVIPIGGADMPVVVSMLNSYSGWAAAGIGFTLHNDLLIITGALVGASGAILSYIMCRGMNRSLTDVIFASSGQTSDNKTDSRESGTFKRGAPEDAAFILKNAGSVIIVPGYGMATSRAQHALKEIADVLKSKGIDVKYAVHPVAGRMPGHMNVLLAEADVSYEEVFELEEINRDFAFCDVAYVVGANDVTNPAAKKDPSSPIYGMPILEVEKAKVVLFLKRSMGTGYSGVDNELFYAPNTMMLLGDAKQTTEAVLKAMRAG
ncbi:MAG: NAD(P)(+) transhydrogenase (Re/Si-specific) subunit beta [Holosporaceae bacterium]|jgi:NAD(P) transhydrogenase subunit beta|nr:NAD(P)(+) transhydrogenase (Re/Si-specific) subunit beta [Holosporaceae bacterium]